MPKKNDFSEKILDIKEWKIALNAIKYAQLLERLVETHGIEEEEALDILSVAATIITLDEKKLF